MNMARKNTDRSFTEEYRTSQERTDTESTFIHSQNVSRDHGTSFETVAPSSSGSYRTRAREMNTSQLKDNNSDVVPTTTGDPENSSGTKQGKSERNSPSQAGSLQESVNQHGTKDEALAAENDVSSSQHGVSDNIPTSSGSPGAHGGKKSKSIFHRESLKNMGKKFTSKLRDPQLHQDNEEETEDNIVPKNEKKKKKKFFQKRNDKDTSSTINEGTEMPELPINVQSSYTEQSPQDENQMTAAVQQATTSYSAGADYLPATHPARPCFYDTASVGQPSHEDMERKMWIKKQERELIDKQTCMSIALLITLGAGVILGIVLSAMSSLGMAFQIMGPIILSLSAFALIYKVYLIVVWKENPYRYFEPYYLNITSRLELNQKDRATTSPEGVPFRSDYS